MLLNLDEHEAFCLRIPRDDINLKSMILRDWPSISVDDLKSAATKKLRRDRLAPGAMFDTDVAVYQLLNSRHNDPSAQIHKRTCHAVERQEYRMPQLPSRRQALP